jgi:hypothetical protein
MHITDTPPRLQVARRVNARMIDLAKRERLIREHNDPKHDANCQRSL